MFPLCLQSQTSRGPVTRRSLESTNSRRMTTRANHVLALAEQLRESFAAETVDRNAVNLLVHAALMKALDIKPEDLAPPAKKAA